MFKRFLGLMVITVVGLSAVVVAGCGGSGNQELTKAEFVKQGNAICETAEEERQKIIAAMAERFDPKGDVPAQQAKIVIKSMPPYEEAAVKLEELGAPAGKSKKLEDLVAAMKEAAERAKEAPQTAVVTNVQFKDADEIAKDLGLSTCYI